MAGLARRAAKREQRLGVMRDGRGIARAVCQGHAEQGALHALAKLVCEQPAARLDAQPRWAIP